MSTPPVIDLERLLAPVPGDNPCGENLRWDPIQDEIKEARREGSKDALDEGEGVQANWRLVFDRASQTIAERSKDLMLTGFLIESAVQLHGFAGLRDGLRALNGMLEQYWENLFPEADGEDLEPRAAPVVWFTESDRGSRLPNRVRDVPLTPTSPEDVVYSWSFWKSRYPQPKGGNEEEGTFQQRKTEADERARQFEDAVATVPVTFYASVFEDVNEALEEVRRLGTVLDEKFGDDSPSTIPLRTAVEECRTLVERILKDKGGLEPEAAEGEEAGETGAATEGGGTPGTSGPIKSRADALRRLEEVASYFRRAEPHSPISYLVQRAATWGSMSFEQLLAELVKDTTIREQIGELLGLHQPQEYGSE